MSNVRLAAAVAVAMTIWSGQAQAQAQKKPLDHDVYDSWQSVSGVKKSDDGSVLVWNVNPQEGDGTLYVRVDKSLKKSKAKSNKTKTGQASELAIPRGYQPTLSPDGNWVVCRIKPEFAKTRQERIKKKKREEQSKDSLAVIDINTMTVKKFSNAESYSTGIFGMPFIAYKSSWKETPKVSKSGLILLTPGTWQADTLKNIDKFVFNNDGDLLALTSKKDKKDSLSATAMFDDASRQLAFTETTDSNKTGSKRCALMLASRAGNVAASGTASRKTGSRAGNQAASGTASQKWAVTELVPQGTTVKGTPQWTLTENSDIYFTPDGQRIMTGIAPIRPPKDTTIIDFETAQLDIWNWDAPYTPPQQKKRVDATIRKTYSAVINLGSFANAQDDKIIIPLTTSEFDNVRLIAGGKTGLALSRDNSDFVRESMWADGSFSDYALVNLSDGSRKPIAKGFNASRFDVSPEGNYLIWFDPTKRAWCTYDIATGATADLTSQTGVAFHTEDDDHPTAYPGPYEGMPKSIEGDQAVLIIDRYDVWKFAPDGSKAENLTASTGRNNHNRFRVIDLRAAQASASHGTRRKTCSSVSRTRMTRRTATAA